MISTTNNKSLAHFAPRVHDSASNPRLVWQGIGDHQFLPLRDLTAKPREVMCSKASFRINQPRIDPTRERVVESILSVIRILRAISDLPPPHASTWYFVHYQVHIFTISQFQFVMWDRESRGTFAWQDLWPPLRILLPISYRHICISMHATIPQIYD